MRQCSRLPSGSKSSAWPNTPSDFAENGIDFSVLPDLTDQDLKEIGVILGHRRKILRAIANLEIERRLPAAASVAPVKTAATEIAERRQVTVMFSDLVGSTAL